MNRAVGTQNPPSAYSFNSIFKREECKAYTAIRIPYSSITLIQLFQLYFGNLNPNGGNRSLSFSLSK